MEGIAGGIGAIWVLLIVVFLLILCVLWVILPFAVFGIKDRLGKLLEESRRQNELLIEVRDILKKIG
jgi:hypothetical protein